MPVVFLPHGGGPWPFVKLGFGSDAEQASLASYLRAACATCPATPPRALLVVSAHWEEAQPTVMNGAAPPLLFDYYGFPPESYELTWPAPGEPAARRARAGAARRRRHPQRDQRPARLRPRHVRAAQARLPRRGAADRAAVAQSRPRSTASIWRSVARLAPLRDEGVFIIGSGMTYHNMRAMGPQGRPAATAFDAWLRDAVTRSPSERDAALGDWDKAPAARAAHPREEHLIPLMVIAGAAGSDNGRVAYHGTLLGLEFSGYAFGAAA